MDKLTQLLRIKRPRRKRRKMREISTITKITLTKSCAVSSGWVEFTRTRMMRQLPYGDQVQKSKN